MDMHEEIVYMSSLHLSSFSIVYHLIKFGSVFAKPTLCGNIFSIEGKRDKRTASCRIFGFEPVRLNDGMCRDYSRFCNYVSSLP